MGKRAVSDDIQIPPCPDAEGRFDVAALRTWLFGSDGAGAYMVGDGLSHLGIKSGDLLIPGSRHEYRLGGVAMFIWESGLPDDDMELIAAGVVVANAQGDPRVLVAGEEWEIGSDRCSYTSPVAGWIPVRKGMLHVEAAQALLIEGEAVGVAPKRMDLALMRQAALRNILQDEIPF